jgi:hypothetical protein
MGSPLRAYRTLKVGLCRSFATVFEVQSRIEIVFFSKLEIDEIGRLPRPEYQDRPE